MPPRELRETLRRLIRRAPFLIIVPPGTAWMKPALGAHLLQAIGRRKGVDVQVLYSSLLFNAMVGVQNYRRVSLLGGVLTIERIFARVAHGLPPLGARRELFQQWVEANPKCEGLWEQLCAVEALTPEFCDLVAEAVTETDVKVVGCSTVFEQTNASLALLRLIKERRPDVMTLLGGPNCEDVMGRALGELTGSYVDLIFSGESEASFAAFLDGWSSGRLPDQRIIEGTPCFDLDSIPAPHFDDFFEQTDALLPECRGDAAVAYESSRGCWWGAKQHCTFCGLNAGGMTFREKSPHRVVDDVREILARTPSPHVDMVDNIMPHRFYKALLPRLRDEKPWGEAKVFYEIKANLTLQQVHSLVEAGVACVQPGIEALSTPLLKLMRKGVTAGQNLRLLRYGRIERLKMLWNFLTEFPGDELPWYAETAALVPLITHLPPPSDRGVIVIERFSPYFTHADDFGITNIRPINSYQDAFPPEADLQSLAYHFQAEYRSASKEDQTIMPRLNAAIDEWMQAWKSPRIPVLHVRETGPGKFKLIDTRPVMGGRRHIEIDAEQARTALVGSRRGTSAAESWALANNVAFVMGGEIVPLATADYELLSRFESNAVLPSHAAA